MFEEYLDAAVVDWLEELPLDELPNEFVKMIVGNFRDGHMSVTEAMKTLNEECQDEIKEYVEQNIEVNKLLEE